MSQDRKKYNFLKNNQGFSLVEVMVTMFIFSFVVLGLFVSVVATDASWASNKASIDLHQQLRTGMEWIKYELSQASTTSISSVPANGTWYTSITFKLPTGISNGSATWDANSVVFQRGGSNNGDLQRVYNGSTRVLGRDLSLLQFRRQASTSNVLEVEMTAQKQDDQRRTAQYSLNFLVKLRN